LRPPIPFIVLVWHPPNQSRAHCHHSGSDLPGDIHPPFQVVKYHHADLAAATYVARSEGRELKPGL
jgi:hypothetical protein